MGQLSISFGKAHNRWRALPSFGHCPFWAVGVGGYKHLPGVRCLFFLTLRCSPIPQQGGGRGEEEDQFYQWKSTNATTMWFKERFNEQPIKNKLQFLQCDIEGFYPNISLELLTSAQRVPDTRPEPEIFFSTRSIQFFQNLWVFRVSGISEIKAFSLIPPWSHFWWTSAIILLNIISNGLKRSKWQSISNMSSTSERMKRSIAIVS